ncbi:MULTISPECIES: galactose ABC transporter substrate-binding protein [Sorangium]|uniref:D-galactose/methyl-galactoside binding periplasmic protein MglB n=1 Tax=Sorangium cellulosum TaxID=56 RepID=A0A4P2QFJ5_SORCE|nr:MULTISPECIES: galactose ABC transporter substrate-binding protein [Sorangium]AUX28228.1 D-galactose-binding protein [Sorangium cellulosum]WCQ87624.1 D-galactose-binding periplasmic protein [Sorangium sp. Soce836]
MRALCFAAAAIAVMMSGCQEGGPSSGAPGSGTPRLAVAIYQFDNTFMSYIRRTIEERAKGKAELNIVDSQNQQPIQNDQVDQFLVQGFKVMAINLVDRTAVPIIVDKAKAKDVPVVFFNREPLKEDMARWDKAYYVGAEAEQSGTMQGEIVVDYWKAHPEADRNKDGKIQYVMLTGEPGHQDAPIRTEYSIKAITGAGLQVEKLAEDTAMWERVKGQEKMAAFLAAHNDKIEVVLANNDDMALGAIEALKAAGYFTGGKYMPVVGVDATPPALDAIANGTLLGTVLNDARGQGQAIFDISLALATGAEVKTSVAPLDGRYVWVPYRKVTKENHQQLK